MPCVGRTILTRFLISLVALAFIGASLPMNCVGGAAMQAEHAMAVPMDDPCVGDTDHAPAIELGKILCGALACAGIVGLPVRQIIVNDFVGTQLYASNTADPMTGISVKPDPFPPRPGARA